MARGLARRHRGFVVAVGVALSLALGPAAHADRSVTVPTTTEAWYLTTPVAAPPGSPAVSPYPSDTLHVGVAGGQEESRTYVALAADRLPANADVTGGTLRLPVADGAGATNVAAARLLVCLAPDPGPHVEGSTAEPPAADCTLSAPAEYQESRNLFVADLSPFVAVLDQGLAVVPRSPGPDESWHVAFYGRENESDDAQPITARIELEEDGKSAAPALPSSPPFATDLHPQESFGSSSGEVGLGAPMQAPVPPAPRAGDDPVFDEAVPEGDGVDARPIAAGVPEPFKYSVIFVLPLVLLVGVPYFGYALTAPVPSSGSLRTGGATGDR